MRGETIKVLEVYNVREINNNAVFRVPAKATCKIGVCVTMDRGVRRGLVSYRWV